MSVKEVLLLGNENLYRVSEEVKYEEIEDVKNIVEDLHDTLIDFRKKYKAGRAIAAPQIEYYKRIIYMNINGLQKIFINPKLEFLDDEMIEVWDDCMCFPNLLVKVKRYNRCKIYYKDLDWKDHVMEVEGDLAELIQHEYDHLDGVLAVSRVIDDHSFKIKTMETKLPRKIGILGGISHESTIKYYELILKKYYELRGDYYYPEIIIYSLDFQKFTDFEDNGDKEGYVNYIMEGIHSLEKSGADFIIMSANSPHSVYDEVKNLTALPMISIVEAVGERAKEKGLKKILLLGIKYTMENGFYENYLKQFGIDVIIPSEEERILINDIIFDELTIGVFHNNSKEKLINIIKKYDVDGVILGCTELPLIINEDDLEIEVLNTVELHVNKALMYSLRME
ncbi:aspartate racemase [Gottschalkia purinilytica]|uniref:Peptide deformylase n=1 Tax=Gottschalkia purinilytica TaxID=1503 RepID=A0A0L0W7U6_GOTPU|nr:amino acid racemase [Gottschalkia purinilytica]KNF07648.1 aspartate racemase [Gottschalkia purinilytica]